MKRNEVSQDRKAINMENDKNDLDSMSQMEVYRYYLYCLDEIVNEISRMSFDESSTGKLARRRRATVDDIGKGIYKRRVSQH